MKPAKVILIFARLVLLYVLITATSLQIKAQCSSGLQSTAYAVNLNGTGNNSWGFVFPQFDPSLGTLVSVTIRSVVSVHVNFQLSDVGASADNYVVLAGRNDNITVSALGSPIASAFSQQFGPYSLQPGEDTVGAGNVALPQFFSLMRNYPIIDSITSAVAGFLGTGNVSFSNSPFSYATVISGSNFSLNTTVSDTMKITLTYYYCTSNILASDITRFSVAKQSNALAKIYWDAENEVVGRIYKIEEGNDGKNFSDFASVASQVHQDGASNYEYKYPIPVGTKGRLYFRLKEINVDGQTKYSEIKSIELDSDFGTYIYPNPASSVINIVISEPGPSDWQAEIFAADGRSVQKCHLAYGSLFHIDLARSLPKGSYFVRLTDGMFHTIRTLPMVIR